MHRRHHELSDHDGDLHSPRLHGEGALGRLRGFLHAHLTWMIEHDYPNVAHYVPDLMANRTLVAVNSYYYSWAALGLLLPAAIGGLATMSLWGALSGMLWGGVVRMFVVEQTMSAINSIMHTFGAQPFVTRDDNSRNLGVMAGSPGARAGTTTTMPSRIPPPSACAGSSSIPASSLSARWKRWDSPGTSRYRVRRRSRGACCDSRAMRRPTWKRAEHHRPAREPTIGTTIRAAPWLSIWLERRSVEGWGVLLPCVGFAAQFMHRLPQFPAADCGP
ncbi:fatty acid desaturase [Bradyrhizobium sp. 142]|nr:fatty acid desaturase [Bradyrhizobium sp. 142]